MGAVHPSSIRYQTGVLVSAYTEAELMKTHMPWKTKWGKLCLSIMDAKGYPIAVVSERPDQSANGRLLAAAPEMLAALQGALAWAELNSELARTLDVHAIRGAIQNAVYYKQCRRCKNELDGVSGLCPDGYGHVEP
jgi:hypothetical protein